MQKDFVICLCALLLGVGGWVGSKEYDKYQREKFAREQAVAAEAARKQLEAQKKGSQQIVQSKLSEQAAENAKKKQALDAARQAVESELVSYKISSIMLGTPNIAIINKKSYEEGSTLPLPSGKDLSLKRIDAETVILSDGQQNYRLTLPTARDLGTAAR